MIYKIGLLLVVIAAINYGLIPLIDKNLIEETIDPGTLLDVIYIAIGIGGVLLIPQLRKTW